MNIEAGIAKRLAQAAMDRVAALELRVAALEAEVTALRDLDDAS